MSDHQYDPLMGQGADQQAENGQPAVRHRRSARYQDAEQENTTAPEQTTRVAPRPAAQEDGAISRMPPRRTPAPREDNTSADRAEAVPSYLNQQRRPARPAAEEDEPRRMRPAREDGEIPAQGVPRPAALMRSPAQMQSQQQGAAGAQRNNADIRRPVNAPGYSQRPPVGSPYARPAQNSGPNEPVRARRPQEPAYDAPQERYEDEKPRRRKGHGCLITLLCVVLVLGLCVLGFLLIPNDTTSPLGQIKATVSDTLSKAVSTVTGLFSKETTPVAQALDFSATNTTGTAPMDVVFTLTTTKAVTDVRVVDEDGQALTSVTAVATDNADSRIWMMNMSVQDGYDGMVQVQVNDGQQWLSTEMSQTLAIASAVGQTIDAGAFSDPVATAEVPVTQAPIEQTGDLSATQAPIDQTGDLTETAAPDDRTGDLTETAAPDDQTDDLTETDEPMTETEAPTEDPQMDEDNPDDVFLGEDLPEDATAAGEDKPKLGLVPTQTPEGFVAPDPTPTLAPTATPTAVPEEATEAPTDTPEPEVTATPAPTEAPALTASADASADPSLIKEAIIYDSSKKLTDYTRATPLAMPAGDSYTTLPFGVVTFRGTAFRQNAALGAVGDLSDMSIAWTAEAGSAKGSSSTYWGIGYTGQPAIIKWSTEVRESSNIVDEKRNTTALKEVILAGLDGKIYFLDLADGQPTRDAIDVGYPMKGSVSLHPLGYPILTVGQYARKMKSGTGDIGVRVYNLLTQQQVYLLDGLDGKLNRPYNEVGAFDTAALIDPTTDTLVTVGTNGMLYTTKLGTEFDYNQGSIKVSPSSIVMKSKTSKQKATGTAAESSPAMYGSYAYYADLTGILRCVDTTTMTTVWAVKTGDAVQATLSLDFDEDGTLWLYTANTLQNRAKGTCDIRRYNAMTGKEDWTLSIGVKKDTKTKVTAGAMASPVIGQKDIADLAIFTLSGLSADATAELAGGDGTAPGMVIAVNKADGKVVWSYALDAYSYSSPVAVYNESGKSWIVQASSSGVLYLLDGATGTLVKTLQLDGTIDASPAVYNSMLVIGTTGKNTAHIYGINLE